MSAYIVFTRVKTINQEELDLYNSKVGPTIGTFGMRPLAIYGAHQLREGAQIEGLVIIEFPTFEDATSWYESPAYQEAREHRFKGANYSCVIVQGI
jgi:uncharacterized protein (DUF1330 family)